MTQLQTPFLQSYRINALRLLGAGSAGLLLFAAAPPAIPVVEGVLDMIGTVAVFTAIAGRAWSLLYIGGRKNAELVTAGPYSMTRNPLYLFSLIGVVGIGAQTGSLLAMILISVLAYLAFEMAIRGEESFLASRYGEGFDAYRRSTPRLWPDTALWREGVGLPLRSAHAIGGLRDGAVFLVAWLGLDCIKLAQSAGLLPILWTLPL
ncbi:methyltransferase family protein [Rhizobium sp. YIM 134829]|uniref:methyltransferase family protein n=1 Tax=Rhizobium sp. YIM 134829 TaxID=3390453 RepID=UPI00397980F8